MSKLYTRDDLTRQFDEDIIWRRRELSDIKQAIKLADPVAKVPLLKALLTMGYAHWEGYIKTCATKYFQFIVGRRSKYCDLDEQFYLNSYLARLEGLYQSKSSLANRFQLIRDIMQGSDSRFAYINKDLIDTKSNLNSDVLRDICAICGVEFCFFEDKKIFLDTIILKRRNSIAHGQHEAIGEDEMDNLIDEILSLMAHFRSLLENKIYEEKYRRAQPIRGH